MVYLNIEAGTIIKAANGTGADASVLVIARGGHINAIGTATAPIIFTTSMMKFQIGDNLFFK